ncbi:MAG: dihydropteroate synthase [Alphaproteobacteria bacterium]|nr:dihydropteroate synthase [Alphaproteobacteria bacterium]
MQCYIGLGSNLGDRRANLEAAGRALFAHPDAKPLKAGPVFMTPALLPPNAPDGWNIPYLNSVLGLNWLGTPQALLAALKNIENMLGRVAAERWAPRVIDLDILLFGNDAIAEPNLQIPHYGLYERSFALDPLLHCAPDLTLPNGQLVLSAARRLPTHAPLWMGILNLTPDSFSDGGALATPEQCSERLETYDRAGVQILDLGAESTRPGALPLTAGEEWQRLEPMLRLIKQRYHGQFFRPHLSIDTYRASTAEKALALGADIINDVSGLTDPAMLPLLKNSACDYVLMHSLSIPADRTKVLEGACDPVATVRDWALEKLALLDRQGIALSRVLLDPGIGFGKTPQQSLTLLQRCQELQDLPVRLLIGHSRKSFMQLWTAASAANRDDAGMGVSLELCRRGVDVLRVHAPERHIAAWLAVAHITQQV